MIEKNSGFIYPNNMNILLTNDDGYLATGICLLKDKLSKYGKVVIVAPKEAMSAKSVAITIGRAVEVKQVENDVFYMDGTPADCVAFGLSSLNIDFDLVVSGCNDGFNISYDIMYSGTVGACLQALTYRKKAVAFSCQGNFDIVDKYFDKVMDYVLKNKLLNKEYLLNINFPLGKNVEDIRITDIYYRKEATFYIKQMPDFYIADRNINDENCKEKDTDVYAVYHNQISITKLNKTCIYKG